MLDVKGHTITLQGICSKVQPFMVGWTDWLFIEQQCTSDGTCAGG